MQLSAPAGDCIGGHQYTHYAGWQAVTAIRNMALPLHSKGFPSLIPNCTFTDPEVASVGLGERDFLAQHPRKPTPVTAALPASSAFWDSC